MESFATNNGLPSLPIGGNVTQQPGLFWRPWTGITAAHTVSSDDLRGSNVFKFKLVLSAELKT